VYGRRILENRDFRKKSSFFPNPADQKNHVGLLPTSLLQEQEFEARIPSEITQLPGEKGLENSPSLLSLIS